MSFFSALLTRLGLSKGGKRTFAALIDQALVSGANFLTNILLARTFGLRDYGVFALVWMAILFVNSLQNALIIVPMMSVGPKQEPEERGPYFGSVLVHEILFGCFSSLVVFIVLAFSRYFYPHWHVSEIAIPVSMASLAYLGQDFLRRYFFCIGRADWALGTDSVSYLLQLPILFWMSRLKALTLSSALWIIAATSLGSLLLFCKGYGSIRFRLESLRTASVRHWKIGRWLVASCFMQWGAGNLFVAAAPIYFGVGASAILRASQNIMAVANVWILGLDNVVPAEAARQMARNDVKGMLRYIRSISLQWGGTTLLFAMIIGAFPDLWLRLAYGSKYAGNGAILRLYALFYLPTFFGGPLRAALQALEYTKPIFWAYPLMILCSIALVGPFSRQLGLPGVTLGLCLTQVISLSVLGSALWIKVRRLRRVALKEESVAV
jgi:O-antigen/teichoic acid export membrane protein